MSGFNNKVIYSIARINFKFEDDLGNSKSGSGTGFWLALKNGEVVFVTNRHNLDPTMHLG